MSLKIKTDIPSKVVGKFATENKLDQLQQALKNPTSVNSFLATNNPDMFKKYTQATIDSLRHVLKGLENPDDF